MNNVIDFFYLVSDPNFATEQTKKQVNLVMPRSNIFEWKRNLFTEISLGYMSNGKLLKHPALNVDTAFQFFKLLDQSIEYSNADWMMLLEPDVWMTGVPKTFPKEAGGIIRNKTRRFKSKIEEYLDTEITPYYSMAGGSIISTKAWKSKRKPINRKDIEDFFRVWPETRCSDALVSMILWKFGIHIEDWPELFESNMEVERRDNATVFHGIKTWYGYGPDKK